MKCGSEKSGAELDFLQMGARTASSEVCLSEQEGKEEDSISEMG